MKKEICEKFSINNNYNFLVLCNDYIVDILKCVDIYNWSSGKLKIKEKDLSKFNSQKYDLFYWRDHGYATSINKLLYKHIIFSILGDYNNYVSDAISCAAKYHFGPAFSLLRKPFKDDLFILEMFYVNGYRSVPEFLNGPIEKFDVSKISPEDKMKILKKCCSKLKLFTARRLFSLRYDKKSKVSLEKIWNPSSHIVTTNPNYATEKGCLNIVFANDKIVEEHIIYFYNVCCSIQLYFLKLLLSILKNERLITEEEYNININNIYFAFLCTLENGASEEVLDDIVVTCSNCSHKFQISSKLVNECKNNNTFIFKCVKCNKNNIINGFILQ